jgi:hypothetical protein
VSELQRNGGPSMVIALAGNKVDLAAKRAVEIEVPIGFFGFLVLFCCSYNIDTASLFSGITSIC